MTRRKPPAMRWESWIDRQIREAQERGEFEDLPGAGQPIPGLDKPHEENWWVKDKLRREGLSYMSPSVALRKEANDALTAALRAPSEAEVRKIISDVNAKIHQANRVGIPGPALMLVPYDAERVVRDWRAPRPDEVAALARPRSMAGRGAAERGACSRIPAFRRRVTSPPVPLAPERIASARAGRVSGRRVAAGRLRSALRSRRRPTRRRRARLRAPRRRLRGRGPERP